MATQPNFPPAPPPRPRTPTARAAGIRDDLIVKTIEGGVDGVQWQLDQFEGVKHPNDVAPTPNPPFEWAPTIRIRDWERGMIMDCSADFDVKFQYNGNSIANINISNVGYDDSYAWRLRVTGEITPDNGIYDNRGGLPVFVDGWLRPLKLGEQIAGVNMARKPCAAMRVRIEFNFSQWPAGGVHKGIVDLVLFGDGTHGRYGRWVQEDFF